MLASARVIRDNMEIKLREKIESKIRKKVSITVIEQERLSNAYAIYRNSEILLEVLGLEICIWTVESSLD